MKQFNYIQAIYKSFYSKEFYRDVMNNWGAGVVLYLFFVLAICWAVIMVKAQPTLTHGLGEFTAEMAGQLPNITIKNGVASTPENHPYFIKDPDTKELIAIVDTSGQYTKLTDNDKNLLLTKHEFWMVGRQGVVKVYKFPDTMTLSINPHAIHEQTVKWAPWAWIILFPFFLLLSFIYRLAQATIYAAIGKILALIGGIRLSYSNTLKLAMIAVTPVIILETILDLFQITLPRELLICAVLSMVYLLYAIWANKR